MDHRGFQPQATAAGAARQVDCGLVQRIAFIEQHVKGLPQADGFTGTAQIIDGGWSN